MVCPNCESLLSPKAKKCVNCGYNLAKNRKQDLEHKKNNNDNHHQQKDENKNENKKSKKSSINIKKFKRLISALLFLIILVITLFFIFSFNANHGKRVADKLSKNLGNTMQQAKQSSKIEVASKSDYSFINLVQDFEYIYESESTVLIDGVNVPKWIVLCTEDKAGNLDSVSYYDYRVLKNNSNGQKRSKKIDTSKIQLGMTRKEVEKFLNIKPLTIIETSGPTSNIVKYKYYYVDKSNKNQTSYYLTVMYDYEDMVNSPILEEENMFVVNILKNKP